MSGVLFEIVKRCSSCSGLVRHLLTFPYRDIGRVGWFWTDGKWIPRMLLGTRQLLCCPQCQALLWIEELELVGYHSWMKEDAPEFVPAPSLTVPSLQQYRSLLEQIQGARLEQVQGAREKEVYLRICMWWHDNDSRRRTTSKAPGLCAREAVNLQELAALLDEEDSYERVLKAEALRELGRFAEATALLAAPIADAYALWAEAVRRLADAEDPRVRAIAK